MMTRQARTGDAGAPPEGGSRPLTRAEVELLARLRDGEDRAYEELVRAETRHLLAVARRLLRNEEDAQDAVQQAFLSAFRAVRGFDGRCSLSTWLHRIVTNAALTHLRARERGDERGIDDLLPRFLDDGHAAEQVREWSLPADARLMRRETRAQVRRAIQQLPASFREVLMLRDIEELSTEEVGRMLGLTTDVVKMRLHRARQALVKLLDPVMHPNRQQPRTASARAGLARRERRRSAPDTQRLG